MNSVIDIVNPDQSLYSTTLGTQTITVNAHPTTSNAQVSAKLYCYTDAGTVNPTAVATQTVSISGANAALPLTVNVPGVGFYELDLSVTDTSGNVEGSKSTTFTVMPVNTPDSTTQFAVGTHAMNGQGNDYNGVSFPRAWTANLDLMAKAGFGRIRDNFYWVNIEGSAGKYTYPASYDNFVSYANGLGMRMLGILGYGSLGNPYGIVNFPTSNTQIAAFAKYAAGLAGHFGSQLTDWEVWNEAGSGAFGGALVTTATDQYAAIVPSTYAAIHAANPSANVTVCAGTVLNGLGDGGALGQCLADVYKLYGPGYVDTWSLHPYMAPANPDTGFDSLGSPIGDHFNVQNVAAYDTQLATQYGSPKQWWSEIGWTSGPSGTGADAREDELTQAAYVARLYLNLRKYPSVGAAFWYDFQDDGVSLPTGSNYFGLIRADFSPKPAYLSMAVLANTLGNKAYQSSLLDNGTSKVYQYATGVGSVIAGWTAYPTAFTTTQTVTVPVPSGTYTLRSWNGNESTVTVTSNSYTWTIGPLPQYLIRTN